MIEDHWTLLKATLLNEGGYDRAIEFIENAKLVLMQEKAIAETRERMSPDYDGLVPHALQREIAAKLGAKRA